MSLPSIAAAAVAVTLAFSSPAPSVVLDAARAVRTARSTSTVALVAFQAAPAPSSASDGPTGGAPPAAPARATDGQSRFVYAAAVAGLIAGGIIASRRKK